MDDGLTPPLDVVWCDFGGVLTPHLDEAIDHIVKASGVPWPMLMTAAEEVARDLGVTGFGPLELGMISQSEWGDRLSDSLPPEQESRIDLGTWDEYWYRDRPVNLELLDALRDAANGGARIGMLTNSVLEWEPHRARMLAGVDLFACTLRSHEIGVAKPDPRIFDLADAALPSDAMVVLIDDRVVNCAAAEAHGWVAIHHVNTARTIARVRELSGK